MLERTAEFGQYRPVAAALNRWCLGIIMQPLTVIVGTSHADAWWTNEKLWAPLIGVLVGFFISQMKELWTLRRHRKAHWAALRTEVELCREAAETYLRDSIKAPLYRLPTLAVENSLPALLAGAWLKEEDAVVLFKYFAEVDTLNRGLSQAQSFRENENNNLLEEEYRRNRIKAGRLIPGNSETTTLYDQVKAVMVRNIY